MNKFEKFLNKPINIPVSKLGYYSHNDIEYKRGEYTGYNFNLNKYFFSLYDGSTIQKNYNDAKFIFKLNNLIDD